MLSVVIGVTGGKVKDGIGNEDIAHALGIKPVFGYLHALQLQTMLFNIWFRPKATADNHVEWNSGRAKLLARLFKLVQDRILDPVADEILDQCQAEMLSTSADPSASPAKPDQALEGGDK